MEQSSAPRTRLKRICDSCLEKTNADAIAVAVVNAGGHRGTAYASDELALNLEDAGFVLGEGPSVDAFAGFAPVLANDLSQPEFRTRWPAFIAASDRLGICSIFAFPLQLGAILVGTMALYGRERGQLDGAQLKSTLRTADDAVLALLETLGGNGNRREYDGFDEAMYRSEVYQASGMLAEQLHVSVGDAILRLRAHSYATDKPVDQVAREVVTRQLRFVNDND